MRRRAAWGRRWRKSCTRASAICSRAIRAISSAYAQFARRRYQASAEARDFVFMMVQDEERHVSLAQVSKLDGRIVGQIAMQGDKEPSYQVDDIGNLLFYRPTPSTITTYRFSPQRLQVARP